MAFDIRAIGDREIELYKYIATDPLWSLDEGTRRLGCSAADVLASLRRLIDVGLVCETPEGHRAALSPERAVRELLHPAEIELLTVRDQIQAMHEQLAALRAGDATGAGRDQVIDIGGPDHLDEILRGLGVSLTELVFRTLRELWTYGDVQPGDRQPIASVLAIDGPGQGSRASCIVSESAFRAPRLRGRLEGLDDLGVELRHIPLVPGSLLLIDQRVVIFPPAEWYSDARLTLTSHPAIAGFASLLLRHLLTVSGDPISATRSRRHGTGGLTRQQTLILQLMAAGEKDATIARRLHLSLRTCRRDIAGIMQNLGALSRFHAGAIAQRLGLLSDR